MTLVEIFLPLNSQSGEQHSDSLFDEVKQELTEKFGGVTAFVRTPAQGKWTRGDGQVIEDEIVIFEVMIDHENSDWWTEYRRALEVRFQQEEVVIRSCSMKRY